jgi:hypothetical protein
MMSEPKDQSPAAQKKQANAREGAKVMAQYEADATAIRARTEKLRAMRLAKEAAEQATAVKKVTARKNRVKEKVPALSEWLARQGESGRRS